MARHPAEEAPELTDAELAEMRPASEVHSLKEFAALTAVRKRGRPLAANPKVRVTLRVDHDTVAAFKATGDGWQTRMNYVLTSFSPKEGRTQWVKLSSIKGPTKFVNMHHARAVPARPSKPTKARA